MMKVYFLVRRNGRRLEVLGKSGDRAFVEDARMKWLDAGYDIRDMWIEAHGIGTKQCDKMTQKLFDYYRKMGAVK